MRMTFKSWSEEKKEFVVPGSFEYEKNGPDKDPGFTVLSVESEGVCLNWDGAQALLGSDVWGQIARWLDVSEFDVSIAFAPQVPHEAYTPLNIPD